MSSGLIFAALSLSLILSSVAVTERAPVCPIESQPVRFHHVDNHVDATLREWSAGYGLRENGDFNGDGELDLALFCLTSEGEVELIFTMGPFFNPTYVEIRTYENLRSIQPIGIAYMAPGVYRTACAKGFGGKCKPDELESITLEHAGLVIGQYETGAELVYWNGGRLNAVWLSD